MLANDEENASRRSDDVFIARESKETKIMPRCQKDVLALFLYRRIIT